MTSVLNTPIEVGLRAVAVLAQVYPGAVDMTRLVLLDHGLLHSEDFGGPEGLHPPLPIRSSELAIKRPSLEAGLALMIRVGLAERSSTPDGLVYSATESTEGFLALLTTRYAARLQERAVWAVERFGGLNEQMLREELRTVTAHWSEEIDLPVELGAGL